MTRISAIILALLVFSGAACGEDARPKRTSREAGTVTIGTTAVVAQMAGAATAGGRVAIELHLNPPTPIPEAVLVWIGDASGRGSVTVKAKDEAGHQGGYEADVAVPSPLPAGSRIWITIEPAAGGALSGSLPIPGPDAKVHEHDHDHESK